MSPTHKNLAFWLSATFAFASLAARMTACSEDVAPASGADAGGDASVDSDAATDTAIEADLQPQPLTITVETSRYGHLELGSRTPAPGALIAVDYPDGTRVEHVADAMGRLELEPTDWSAGPVAITVYVDGYSMYSWVSDQPPEQNRLAVTLFPMVAEEPDTVTVSGTVLNALPEASFSLQVAADVPGATRFDARSHRWSIQVPTGVPFKLWAVQYALDSMNCYEFEQPVVRAAVLAHEAVTEATTDVVIDFDDDAVAPRVVTGSFTVPNRAGNVVRAGGWGYVRATVGENVLAGLTFPSRMRFDIQSGRYEYELATIPGIGTGEPLFVIQVREGCGRQWNGYQGEYPWETYIYGRGSLEGDQGRVLDIPEWRVEPNCNERFSLEEPLAWENHEEDVYAGIAIERDGTQFVWWLQVGPGLSSVRVPDLPSGVSASDIFGSAPTAQLENYQPRDPDPSRRWATAYSDDHLPITPSCE